MFKFFTVGALLYILYRITFTPNLLTDQGKKKSITDKDKNIDDDEYVDYEEVD